jgi:hypothetical protein
VRSKKERRHVSMACSKESEELGHASQVVHGMQQREHRSGRTRPPSRRP